MSGTQKLLVAAGLAAFLLCMAALLLQHRGTETWNLPMAGLAFLSLLVVLVAVRKGGARG